MSRVILILLAMTVALVVSAVLRRRSVDAPTQGSFEAPSQLNRNDFASPDSPWLVALFSSSTCNACADVASKAAILSSREVAVVNVDYVENKDLHARYKIEAVPTLVIADEHGVVQKAFLGPVKAQDLWAAVANCREPGAAPESCQNHSDEGDHHH
jgi:thioredoxin-related protein